MIRRIAWSIAGVGVAIVFAGKNDVSELFFFLALILGALSGVIYSVLLDRNKGRTNQIIWLTLSLATLPFIFFGQDGRLVAYYGMILFSLPISLIIDGVNYLVFSYPINDFVFLFWIISFIAGYIQWFVIIPRLKSLRRRHRAN